MLLECSQQIKVTFFQITLAATHGGNTKHFENAIQAMEEVEGIKISAYVVVYVVPEGHVAPTVTICGGLTGCPRLSTLSAGEGGKKDINVQFATIKSKFINEMNRMSNQMSS